MIFAEKRPGTGTESPANAGAPTDRRWTVSNLLTIGRMALTLPLAGCALLDTPWTPYLAFAIFVVAALTDLLDGYLARRLNQRTRFGEIFDPIADKLVVCTALVLLIAWQRLNGLMLIPALVILLRELYVSGVREEMAGRTLRLAVSPSAKWKTGLQLTAISLLLLGVNWSAAGVLTFHAGLAMLWLAAVLSLYSAWRYTGKAFGGRAPRS